MSSTSPPSDRLDRIEAILEVLSRETLANVRASAANAEAIAANAAAIAELTCGIEQLKRTTDYRTRQDGA